MRSDTYLGDKHNSQEPKAFPTGEDATSVCEIHDTRIYTHWMRTIQYT